MKKVTLSLVFIAASICLFAQATKYPVLLHFTNSNCGNCAGSNPGFFTKMDVYNKNVHHITVHPSFPYSSCVFYQGNITDNTLLVGKYGAQGTPTISINGAKTVGVGSVTDAQLKASFTGLSSPIQVKVNENTGASRTVKATIKSTGTVPAANYVVYAVVVEKLITQTTGNGEKTHRNVLRKIISAGGGDSFTPEAAGKEKVLNFSYTVDSKWKESEIYTIVWVQDGNNNILNSGTKFDVTVGTEDILDDSSVRIFPNPTSNELKIDLTNINATPEQIFIQNLEGKNVAQFNAVKDINTLNISTLPQGEYIISVKTDRGVLSQKCLKI